MLNPYSRFMVWLRRPRSLPHQALSWLIGSVLVVALWPLALALYLMDQPHRGLVVARVLPLFLAVAWIPYLSLFAPTSERDAETGQTVASRVSTTTGHSVGTDPPPDPSDQAEAFAGFNESSEGEMDRSDSSKPTNSTGATTQTDFIPRGDIATVVSVTDGDTIRVVISGIEEPLRLIGLDAPEVGECLSVRAMDRLSQLVEESEVELVRDQSDRDQFDRLLRYVYLDGQLVNEILVAEGLAIARRYDPDIAMAERLESAQAMAEETQVGLWDPAACGAPADVDLSIGKIHYDAAGDDNANLNDEWVEIVNDGPAVDMTGWVLKDESASHRYSFPAGFRLEGGASVRVYTGCGANTASELYWCNQGSAVWNNSSDTVFLLDASGNISDHQPY